MIFQAKKWIILDQWQGFGYGLIAFPYLFLACILNKKSLETTLGADKVHNPNRKAEAIHIQKALSKAVILEKKTDDRGQPRLK